MSRSYVTCSGRLGEAEPDDVRGDDAEVPGQDGDGQAPVRPRGDARARSRAGAGPASPSPATWTFVAMPATSMRGAELRRRHGPILAPARMSGWRGIGGDRSSSSRVPTARRHRQRHRDDPHPVARPPAHRLGRVGRTRGRRRVPAGHRHVAARGRGHRPVRPPPRQHRVGHPVRPVGRGVPAGGAGAGPDPRRGSSPLPSSAPRSTRRGTRRESPCSPTCPPRPAIPSTGSTACTRASSGWAGPSDPPLGAVLIGVIGPVQTFWVPFGLFVVAILAIVALRVGDAGQEARRASGEESHRCLAGPAARRPGRSGRTRR